MFTFVPGILKYVIFIKIVTGKIKNLQGNLQIIIINKTKEIVELYAEDGTDYPF